MIQFSCTNGEVYARPFFNPPTGISIYTSTVNVTFLSNTVYRPATNDRTVTTWTIKVEIDYQADTTYPGGFELDCRCDVGGSYFDIPTWSNTMEFIGTMMYICLDDNTITNGTFNWAPNSVGAPTPPVYDLNGDIGSCPRGGTLDPPNPNLLMQLRLINGSTNWDPGATDCSGLLTSYYDARFNFEILQSGGCDTGSYGTPAELTIRFGWT